MGHRPERTSTFPRSRYRLSENGLAMRFGLCFGLLLARLAALDSYDVVLYGGDRSPRTRPYAYRESFVHGFAYLKYVENPPPPAPRMPAWRMISTASSLLKAFTSSRLHCFISATLRHPTSRRCLLPHKATHAATLDAFYITPVFRSIQAFDHAEWNAVRTAGR